MWALDNNTPYAAERNWVRDKYGGHYWIVAVKASYSVTHHGQLVLLEEQVPPLLAPEFRDDPGTSSLTADSNLGLPKPQTDVIVNGDAFAPGGRPTEEVAVRLRFGNVNKTLLVRGDNIYYKGSLFQGMRTTKPQPFDRMPIIFERAFGGFDTSDPDPSRHRLYAKKTVGVGFAVNSDSLDHTPGPNILYPGQEPDSVGPAGFGAIASHWSPRRELAGTYDEAWVEQRQPLAPLDYNEQHELCSPIDQRGGRLAPGDAIELVNMNPSGIMRFELPRSLPVLQTFFGRRIEDHTAHLATVILEPEQSIVRIVWQSSLAVASTQVDYLDKTLIEERAL